MLTRGDLETHVSGPSPKLIAWRPGQSQSEYRQFFVTPNVARDLSGPWAQLPGETRSQMLQRRLKLYALVARWLDGGPILPWEELKPLEPRRIGLWEFRSVYPRPGSRLIGWLGANNVFIATGLYRRDLLGAGGSGEWETACAFARAAWNQLFPNLRPMTFEGRPFDEHEARAFWDDRAFRYD